MQNSSSKTVFFTDYLMSLVGQHNDPNSPLIILTPNQRLARHLQKQLEIHTRLHQVNLNNPSHESPCIMPFNTWLESLLVTQQAPDNFLLLNHNQEYTLWENVINISQNVHNQYDTRNTSSTTLNNLVLAIMDAWHLINHWELALEQLTRYARVDDTLSLLQWVNEFIKQLHDNSWHTLSETCGLLCSKLKNNKLFFTYNYGQCRLTLSLVGFENCTFSPLEKKFLSLCEQQGCAINYFNPNQPSNRMAVASNRHLAFDSNDDEIATMAQWAHKIFSSNRNCSIGCIIPDLNSMRDRITRIFTETFTTPVSSVADYSIAHNHKDIINSKANQLALPFNISLGQPLSQHPLIDSALNILNFGKAENEINLDDWQKLLASPFISDNWLNQSKQALAWEEIKNLHFPNHQPILMILKKSCPSLADTIKNYQQNIQHIPPVQTAESWLNIFNQELQKFNWPGTRPLTSAECQTMKRWQTLAHEFVALDLAMPQKLSYTAALQKLAQIAHNTIFQPSYPGYTDHHNQHHDDPAINILGTLESTGLNFDYLWIMGMDDHSWPPTPKPNSLLPLALQKKLSMPNASAERELEFCRNLTNRWHCSAPTIIYSYTRQQDEEKFNISPLLRDVPLMTKQELISEFKLEPKKQLAQQLHQNSKLEKYIDNTAPPITADEKISGGSKILQAQACCPFQAFARYRLHAYAPTMNFTKILRGNILHKSLELIWQTIKNRDTLLEYLQPQNEARLHNIITAAVDQSITFYVSAGALHLPSGYLTLEKKCLHRLLLLWLDKESKRDFFTVIATEKSVELTIEALPLKLRIDRIDQLQNNKLIIIDYKTGVKIPSISTIKNSFITQADAIQLPLYGIAIKEPIAAILFAHVNSESNRPFGGAIDDNKQSNNNEISPLPSKDRKNCYLTDLAETMSNWQTTLQKLAGDFSRGIANIAPLTPNACKQCDLHSLCRVNDELIA